MIPKKYSGDELRNRYCRPVRKIRNGAGAAISPETICRIVSVVRGHGFTIETEKCPHCGQSAYISRVSRDDLELVENPLMEDLLNDGGLNKSQFGSGLEVLIRGEKVCGIQRYLYIPIVS